MPYKKSVHLDKSIHKKLKNRATEKDISIEKELNDILKKVFEDEEYLDDWQPLPENKTVDFGFFEMDMPEIPETLEDPNDLDVLLTVIIIIIPLGFGLVYFKIRKGANRTVKTITNGQYPAFSLSKDSVKYYLRRIKKNKSMIKTIFVMIGLVLLISVIIFIILRNFGFIT